MTVRRRDDSKTPFDPHRISTALAKALDAADENRPGLAEKLAEKVVERLAGMPSPAEVTIEQIQDMAETVLIEEKLAATAKAFILYRQKRKELREQEALAPVMEGVRIPHVDKWNALFAHKSKLSQIMGPARIQNYQSLLFQIKTMQYSGQLPIHPDNEYLGGSELATSIYEKKYYLKDISGTRMETRPEDVFARLSSFIAAVETTEEKQRYWSQAFYRHLYEGHFIPGGRVIAGAGDLYRLKTLANCFVSLIQDDNIESIYQTAFECARTYSYGGGIGVDISVLRPKDSVVHNAADHSTGSVSFMELYSLTTGLIGQSGRRGALMLTVDIKHPDVVNFIRVKKDSNWVTKQIVEQAKWSNKFNSEQLLEIERQVRENTQVRFANISVKVNDEFMASVEEQNQFPAGTVLVYKKLNPSAGKSVVQTKENHYSFGIPSRNPADYVLAENFRTVADASAYLSRTHGITLAPDALDTAANRDMFGDYVIDLPGKDHQLALRFAGDFMMYFNAPQTGELKRLVKAREIWNPLVEGNYKTAEPGLIFWSTMSKYSPSNYVGRPIASTNPCGEVPLEDGGACNLGSLNLARFVSDGYSPQAEIDWAGLKDATHALTRFLDNVVTWNETLNALPKQRDAARLTRRLGLGIMGIADMLNQLGLAYDSEEGIALMGKVMEFVANQAYEASADLAAEKGPSEIFDYEKYAKNPFFQESLSPETRAKIKTQGLRNIAILSIAPTGTISNIPLSIRRGTKHYVGSSGGIEPIFSLYYTRRSESFGNVFFKVFHPTVQAYVDLHNLQEKVQAARSIAELRTVLPAFFFRTAHFIDPQQRVLIQGICQQFVDHSISSTINLSEDIEPEVISEIYLAAWKNRLKGLTVYRDGSRYPILSVESEKSLFQTFKEKSFKITQADGVAVEMRGDEVFALPNGRLTTLYHVMQQKTGALPAQEGNTHATTRPVQDKN